MYIQLLYHEIFFGNLNSRKARRIALCLFCDIEGSDTMLEEPVDPSQYTWAMYGHTFCLDDWDHYIDT